MKIVKVCCKCKMQLEVGKFSKDSRTYDRFQSKCKVCSKALIKDWCEANKDKIKVYNDANKDKRAEVTRVWYEANPDRAKAKNKAWRKANSAKTAAHTAKRRASKLKATPSWLTKEDYNQMQAFYDQAQQLTLSTGVQHQVDHIYPLQGETVCGLHVPSNLQVLTAAENCSKSNKFLQSD